MAALTEGWLYLMPSKKLARCTHIGESICTFEYSTEDGVTLSRDFAEHNLVLFGGIFDGKSS